MKNILNKKKNGRSKNGKKKSRPIREKPRLPILCRPGAEMSYPLYLIGWAMRSLVLFCGVFGLTLFIGDGFGIYGDGRPGSIPALAIVSLAITIVCSAAAWNRRARFIAPLCGAVIGIGSLFFFTSNPFVLIWDGVRCLLNTAMLHMAEIGYTSFANNLIGSQSYHGSDTLVLGVGCAVLAVVIAAILAVSLLRRVRTAAAVILSVIIIVPVFVYNLTRGNAGVSMVLIFIFGEISLLIYERKFSNYEAKRIEKKEAKAAKTAAKKEKKRLKKEQKEALDKSALRAYAIAIELTDDKKEARAAKAAVYRLNKQKTKADKKAAKAAVKAEARQKKADKKAASKAKAAEKKASKAAAAKERAEFKKLSPEEKAAKFSAKKSSKKAKAAAEKEKRQKQSEAETAVRKTLAASGYAGGAAVIAAALAVWLPFAAITGNFFTIDFINDPVSVVREYVTAYLKGDDIDLNKLGSIAELTPRTLTYDSPEYNQIQMLAVETERMDPVYLRGWIGMRFDSSTGTWTSGTTDDVVEYRNKFGKSFTPDMLKTKFLEYMLPTAVEADYNPILKFSDYGFDVRQIHLRRINGSSLIIYAAPTINSDLGILEYNSIQKNSARYSAYFDGIYSSRFFDKDVNYSTISFTGSLNDPDVGDGMTGIIEYFELFLKYTDILEEAESVLRFQPSVTLRKYDTGRGSVMISSGDFTDIDRLFSEECENLGLPRFTGESILYTYIYMTQNEREEIKNFVEDEIEYREWADLKYAGSVHSGIVSEIADSLLDEAGYSRDTKINSITPVYKDQSGDEVNEHDVVMTVINYLRDNYTYTLEPEAYEGTDMTVLDSFLSETKNGYCTHFATAAAAILREYGYSVRYAEGYLVSEFTRNYADDAPAKYKGYAMDENAHAWIEVYYPLLGWVPYETVPAYMAQMYDTVTGEDGNDVNHPIINIPDNPLPEPENPDIENPEEPEIPLEEPEEPAENSVDQLKILMICSICLGVVVIIFIISKIIIKRIIKKAETAVADRHYHIITAMDTELLKRGKIDTSHIAREFDDTILRIFRLLGYPPKTGEQYSSYAERLEEDFGGMTNYSLKQIFDLIAKVEFGSGLSPEEMYILADFTDRLTVSAYAGLSRFEKIKYRYLKRII